MRMYQRRRTLSPEETAANAKAREQRTAACMHCQVCSRDILANKGTIAHHGYTRPGHGWQTSSCFGAKRLPFEVDRTALGEFIGFLHDQHDRMVKTRAAVSKEEIPVTLTYQEWQRAGDRYSAGRYVSLSFDISRVSWHGVKNAEETLYRERNPRMTGDLFGNYGWSDFDHVLKVNLASRDSEIRMIKADINEFTKRYEGWKQTHKRENDQWVALDKPVTIG
jgi:hypothetical protein